ncbi:hypothetical protein NBM05_08450 [Rothia sp. AR01]|uniref:Uncharacterized protein n=1 Tax=Rothia santali TaxID=2949643 RepID=A0A9X2HHY2_9MICC|nr:hypothetical protein [Rothia santali]MCP3426031.1 hypothetical protein [Rothia santali]
MTERRLPGRGLIIAGIVVLALTALAFLGLLVLAWFYGLALLGLVLLLIPPAGLGVVLIVIGYLKRIAATREPADGIALRNEGAPQIER